VLNPSSSSINDGILKRVSHESLRRPAPSRRLARPPRLSEGGISAADIGSSVNDTRPAERGLRTSSMETLTGDQKKSKAPEAEQQKSLTFEDREDRAASVKNDVGRNRKRRPLARFSAG
jgi:hypothetical protein